MRPTDCCSMFLRFSSAVLFSQSSLDLFTTTSTPVSCRHFLPHVSAMSCSEPRSVFFPSKYTRFLVPCFLFCCPNQQASTFYLSSTPSLWCHVSLPINKRLPFSKPVYACFWSTFFLFCLLIIFLLSSLMLLGAHSGGGSKTPKGGKFLQRQLSLRSFQQTVKNHASTINKASNVK